MKTKQAKPTAQIRYKIKTKGCLESVVFDNLPDTQRANKSLKSATGIIGKILILCDLCDNPREIENLCANCAEWSDGNLDSNN